MDRLSAVCAVRGPPPPPRYQPTPTPKPDARRTARRRRSVHGLSAGADGGVRGPAFPALLRRLDECLDFMLAHPQARNRNRNPRIRESAKTAALTL